ncbi:uncharacterized protein LOC114306005 [Camellia sinensis]|uniref:uncharacterized protein LOC114306005 n=1 Tax=Camellia sinensis TaxID=4442 RepID=UPI001036ADA5|nr:uncharacterized protein LOC114306005 [Camellia sinensis]
MDKGKQPAQGDWVTIARKANSKEEKVYVAFAGKQPGIYTEWNDCKTQVCEYSGASYKAYDSMTKAKKAFYSAPAMPVYQKNFCPMRTNPVPTNIQISIPDESEIKDFFNPGISEKFIQNSMESGKLTL